MLKDFCRMEKLAGTECNAARDKLKTIGAGQDVLIIIGEKIKRRRKLDIIWNDLLC